jgi:hypothetical protein
MMNLLLINILFNGIRMLWLSVTRHVDVD